MSESHLTKSVYLTAENGNLLPQTSQIPLPDYIKMMALMAGDDIGQRSY